MAIPEVRRLAWYPGTSIDQIYKEIWKVAGLDELAIGVNNMLIYDQDDCAIVLSEDIDLDQVYKVSQLFIC